MSPDRELHPRAKASFVAIRQLDITTVLPRNRPGGAEAKADASGVRISGRLQPIKRCEHLFAFSEGNSRTVILDRNDDLLSLAKEPNSCITDAGAHVNFTYYYSEHIVFRAFADCKELTGDVAHSPIVERKQQVLVGLGIGYRFER